MFKEAWQNVLTKLIEGIEIAGKEFIKILWGYLREEVILSARKSLGIIKTYLESADGISKKEEIINLIMLKIKLPLVLKPFKGLVRNIVKDKIDDVIKELLEISEDAITGRFKITG